MLDHILLGAKDLDEGIAYIEKLSGVRAAVGGSHPGVGTRNALLSLGAGRYLEIIAPDPEQAPSAGMMYTRVVGLSSPRLISWAYRTTDLAGLAERIAKAGIAVEGLSEGSRKRTDGSMLRWKTLRVKDDLGGVLPFFIEWERGTKHPSDDAPAGCRLSSFSATSADPKTLAELFRRIEIEVKVDAGMAQKLIAKIESARGEFELTN